MRDEAVVIVGAGVGGLTAAALLAARGLSVTVVEAEAASGGKLRARDVGGVAIDAGPTVFTMRDVFDALFDECGASLDDHLSVRRADRLARHAWPDGARLDLFADREASEGAIADFAGAGAVSGYRAFRAEAERLFYTLDRPFLHGSKTDPLTLGWRIGWRGFPDYLRLRAYQSMWDALGGYFSDPRLRQLFARYSTYCGSSPFQTPATLMLIAHVEAAGVWLIEGGMHRLAHALQDLGTRQGVRFRFGERVERILIEHGRAAGVRTDQGEIHAASVIVNADPAALGALGVAKARAVAPPDRSLSALVWTARGQASGMAFDRHNVVFSSDYRAEFVQLGRGFVPSAPSVYIHAAQDPASPGEDSAFQIIVNAPANGDTHRYTPEEIDACEANMLRALSRCGVTLALTSRSVLTPNDFERLNRSTGGALYGRASHGWAASFLRQGSRTPMPGLYCAGGSCHPGAGVPMAALSGRLASEALLSDRVSTARSRPRATAGGMSTRSAMPKDRMGADTA